MSNGLGYYSLHYSFVYIVIPCYWMLLMMFIDWSHVWIHERAIHKRNKEKKTPLTRNNTFFFPVVLFYMIHPSSWVLSFKILSDWKSNKSSKSFHCWAPRLFCCFWLLRSRLLQPLTSPTHNLSLVELATRNPWSSQSTKVSLDQCKSMQCY